MPPLKYYRTARKTTNHSTRAAGSAQTRARAKLRRGPRPALSASGSIRGVVSSIIAALNITPKGLPPLARPRQRRGRDFSSVPATPRAAFGSAPRPHGLARQVWDEVATLAFVVQLAFRGDCQREAQFQRIIALGMAEKADMRPLLVPRLALLLVCLLSPRLAYAQAADPAVITPVELFLPENSPGVRLSPSLILKPGLDASLLYDTNIYNQDANPRSDTVAIVKPSVDILTDWSRHFVKLNANAEVRRYFRTAEENSEQWQIGALASLDLANRTKFDVAAGIARQIEPRGTAGDAFNTDSPVKFTQKRLAAELARTGGILELIAGASLSKFDYDDASLGGVPIDLSSRDVAVRQAHIRANYRLGPKLGLFADLSGNQVDYEVNPGVSRNSSGYGILAGLRYQVTALLDAEIAAGFMRQSFKDPLVRPVSGVNYAVTVNWTPTPRWKLTASGHRSVEPGPLANVPAIVRSTFDLKAQRAVSDTILVELTSGFVRENYRGAARNDNRYFAQAAVSYRLSSRILASALAGYRKQDSSVPGRSYHGFTAGVSASLRL